MINAVEDVDAAAEQGHDRMHSRERSHAAQEPSPGATMNINDPSVNRRLVAGVPEISVNAWEAGGA